MTLPRRDPIFLLDGPPYHRVRLGHRHHFSGIVLSLDALAVQGVVVQQGGVARAEAAVDRESPDMAAVTALAGADRCRFELELEIEEPSEYVFLGLRPGEHDVPLFVYDAAYAVREAPHLTRVARAVAAMPMPPPDLVSVTQGGDNVEAYRDSLVSAQPTLCTLLSTSGLDPARLRRILDIGCGTGRLLVGWHLDDASRELVGLDIDPACIAWNRRCLLDVARWDLGRLNPPLPFDNESFDLIMLASVFTHLSLDTQRRWVGELARLVRRGGAVVVTLLGEPYAATMLNPVQQHALHEGGHVEIESGREGSHGYRSFHDETFARRLFGEFARVDVYPRGAPRPGPARRFPMAALQDVYVLLK